MTQSWDYNSPAAGQRYLPASHDPTLGVIPAATAASPGALPDDFLRPIVGFGSISISSPAVSARYDSLQVSANHRSTGRGDIGNNCNNAKFTLPGFNNHDLSLFKMFRLELLAS
jgi:hypothetical protein